MKKNILIIALVIFIAPSIALASWWNPFTWHWSWSKKIVPQEQVQQTTTVTLTEKESPKEINSQEDKTVDTSPAKIEEKKTSIPVKPAVPVITVPVYTPPPARVVITPSVVELSISDVSTDAESNSVRVNWKTSISSESKILLDGKSYFSKRGVGTVHYTDIDGLESNLYYGGTITAIANNAWKNQNFNFTTKSTPLKITVTRQNCPSDRCTLSWETNYKSDGRIKIYKTGSNQIVKSLNSPLENSKEHSLEFKLEPNTKYTFEIYATSDNESAETTGQFETITPCTGTCA